MGVLGGAVIVCGVGVLDDIRELDWVTKLAGQMLAAGVMAARTKLTTASSGKDFAVSGSAYAPAVGLGGDLGLTLKPGRLVIGLRYLWSQLGRTSQGDEITGNSAGLIGDVGYRMTF